MILPFSTQINRKPTYFMEKILTGLFQNKIISADEMKDRMRNHLLIRSHGIYQIHLNNTSIHNPKLHTIREDKNERWQPGVMIDFFINARQKNMFRFAPRIPAVSTQDIFMTRRGSMLEITIAKVGSYIGDNDFYLDAFQQGELSKNDGFDEYDDFRNYFLNAIEEHGKKTGNYWFSGKIIHWTDLKY